MTPCHVAMRSTQFLPRAQSRSGRAGTRGRREGACGGHSSGAAPTHGHTAPCLQSVFLLSLHFLDISSASHGLSIAQEPKLGCAP